MIAFKTESGSLYEVDAERKLFRSQRCDWRPYVEMSEPVVGERVAFFFDNHGEPGYLCTSFVTEIVRNDMIEIEIVSGEDN